MIGSSAKLKQLPPESVEFSTTTDIIKLAANLQSQKMKFNCCPASDILCPYLEATTKLDSGIMLL